MYLICHQPVNNGYLKLWYYTIECGVSGGSVWPTPVQWKHTEQICICVGRNCGILVAIYLASDLTGRGHFPNELLRGPGLLLRLAVRRLVRAPSSSELRFHCLRHPAVRPPGNTQGGGAPQRRRPDSTQAAMCWLTSSGQNSSLELENLYSTIDLLFNLSFYLKYDKELNIMFLNYSWNWMNTWGLIKAKSENININNNEWIKYLMTKSMVWDAAPLRILFWTAVNSVCVCLCVCGFRNRVSRWVSASMFLLFTGIQFHLQFLFFSETNRKQWKWKCISYH